jgi:hypothetical protein
LILDLLFFLSSQTGKLETGGESNGGERFTAKYRWCHGPKSDLAKEQSSDWAQFDNSLCDKLGFWFETLFLVKVMRCHLSCTDHQRLDMLRLQMNDSILVLYRRPKSG